MRGFFSGENSAFFIGGIIVAFLAMVTCFAAIGAHQALQRVETTPLLDSIIFFDTPDQTQAFLESRISERNEIMFRDFVAYEIYHYEEGTDEDDDEWVFDERIAPPIWIEIDDGQNERVERIRLINRNYDLTAPPVDWSPDETIRDGSLSYQGFRKGDQALIFGRIQRQAEDPQFEADWIYGGTMNDYISDQRVTRLITGGLSLLFSGIFIILIIIFIRKRF